jgi:DNA-binding winged helix-turn-helix (wHTH) protein
MGSAVYHINNEFRVFPEKNQVNEIHIEPRIMKLICLLIENNGKLVRRDHIVEKLWNGYGGGDEGLTQAISFIRKIFKDKTKKIIETVPKSGYIFNAGVEKIEDKKPATSKYSPFLRHVYVAGSVVLLLTITFFLLGNSTTAKTPAHSGFRFVNHDSLHRLKHQQMMISNNKP